MNGRIIAWTDRGYGWLRSEVGADIFVHRTAFEASDLPEPTVGQRFDFDVVETRPGKPQAENVRAAAEWNRLILGGE